MKYPEANALEVTNELGETGWWPVICGKTKSQDRMAWQQNLSQQLRFETEYNILQANVYASRRYFPYVKKSKRVAERAARNQLRTETRRNAKASKAKKRNDWTASRETPCR